MTTVFDWNYRGKDEDSPLDQDWYLPESIIRTNKLSFNLDTTIEDIKVFCVVEMQELHDFDDSEETVQKIADQLGPMEFVPGAPFSGCKTWSWYCEPLSAYFYIWERKVG